MINFVPRTGGKQPRIEQIRAAALAGDVEKLDLLLKTKYSFAADELHVRSQLGALISDVIPTRHNECLRLLLKAKGRANYHGHVGKESAMAVAATCENLEALQILIDAGGDVNLCPPAGKTPLVAAAAAGKLAALQFLLKAGAHVNQRCQLMNTTALLEASRAGHLPVVEALLAAGAKLCADARGETPLYFACAGGHQQVAVALLNAGADVNAITKEGYNALYAAVKSRRVQLVDLLLQNCAKINITSGPRSILSVAIENNFQEIVRTLLIAGADPGLVTDLSMRSAASLPHYYSRLVGLTSVRLQNCTELPPPVPSLTKLTLLEVRQSPQLQLPPEFAKFTALTDLYLENLTHPLDRYVFARMVHLQRLIIHAPSITTLPLPPSGTSTCDITVPSVTILPHEWRRHRFGVHFGMAPPDVDGKRVVMLPSLVQLAAAAVKEWKQWRTRMSLEENKSYNNDQSFLGIPIELQELLEFEGKRCTFGCIRPCFSKSYVIYQVSQGKALEHVFCSSHCWQQVLIGKGGYVQPPRKPRDLQPLGRVDLRTPARARLFDELREDAFFYANNGRDEGGEDGDEEDDEEHYSDDHMHEVIPPQVVQPPPQPTITHQAPRHITQPAQQTIKKRDEKKEKKEKKKEKKRKVEQKRDDKKEEKKKKTKPAEPQSVIRLAPAPAPTSVPPRKPSTSPKTSLTPSPAVIIPPPPPPAAAAPVITLRTRNADEETVDMDESDEEKAESADLDEETISDSRKSTPMDR